MLPSQAGAETIEPGQPGSIYSSPMVNWTSIGIPRQQADGQMLAEGSGFTSRETKTVNGVPVATGSGATFAYNYENVELTIESEWQTASTSASPAALQVNYDGGYYDTYKDDCLSAGGYAAGEVVTCNASRLVTYTFSEPVWFPKFGNQYATSGLRDARGNIELVQFEEMKVVSINDGTNNRKSAEYNGGNLPFYPTYRIDGFAEWFTDGVDAQGNYINTLDLSKYAVDDTGFNRYTAAGAVPGSTDNAVAFPQFGVPGFVKSITLEYTPKILVNDPTVVDEWNAGVTRTVGNAGAEITLPLKDLLDWNTEGSAPRYSRYGAYVPRTDYTVTKDFTEADGVTPVAKPASPGSEVYFNVSVANTGGMNSWGYVALDDMPKELDPKTVELVRVESTQGDAATNTYVGVAGGANALATPGTKVEVVDGKFRIFRVGVDYKISGGNDPLTAAADVANGTNLGRVSPKDPTNTTVLPTGGLLAGQTDTYVFKAKLKKITDLEALGTGLCGVNANVINTITAYDSVVNPNDAASDDANLTVECQPDFSFEKTSDFNAATAKVGDTITYTFSVTNTGDMTLSSFEITDPLPGLSEITYPADRSLAVDETKEATATYVLTDKDVVAGEIINTATATVVPFDSTPDDPSDDVPPPAPKTDDEVIQITATPDFSFEKTSDFNAATAKVGDTITYTFSVTNTGNMTLSSFEITDPLPGLSEITYPADRSLAVGETKEATATYVLTQADFAAGKVYNKAKATVVPFDPTPKDSSDNVPPPAPKTDDVKIPLTIKTSVLAKTGVELTGILAVTGILFAAGVATVSARTRKQKA